MKLLTTWFIDQRPFSNVKLRPQVLPGHLMGPARESLVLPFKQSLIAQQLLVVVPHTLLDDMGPHIGWHWTTRQADIEAQYFHWLSQQEIFYSGPGLGFKQAGQVECLLDFQLHLKHIVCGMHLLVGMLELIPHRDNIDLWLRWRSSLSWVSWVNDNVHWTTNE